MNNKLIANDNLQGLYCIKPFKNAEFHLNGEVFVCCPSWLQKSIGNLQKNSIKEIWNSDKAQEIRTSILDGSYRFCNHDICPHIQSKNLFTINELEPRILELVKNNQTALETLPEEIMLTYDLSCNLSCPSCRTEKISFTADTEQFKQSQIFTDIIYNEFISDLGDHRLTLNITGSGDPFASLAFRQFIESIDGKKYPNLKIEFQTNGLLLTPIMWERLKKIWPNIDRIFVSIDAASEETYLVVRRGGNWNLIRENMKFLARLRKEKKFNLLQANFVVQKKNYNEMAEFAKMFIDIGCDSISFSLLNDWGTWPKDEFNNQLVWKENHLEFQNFLKSLENNIFSHHRIYLGNLTQYRNLAIGQKRNNSHPTSRVFINLSEKMNSHFQYLLKKKFFLPKKIISFIKKFL